MQTQDLTGLSLQEAAAAVCAKDISPVALTRACLERIEWFDPTLRAFITVTAEEALAQASAAEMEIARGAWRGPLHGIPIGLKDLVDTAGVRTTGASALFADRVPEADAEVVRRLRAAGAVFLGKLNMQEFAYGGGSVVSHFGAVHNPWDLTRIAGGSSGGSAAAVVAGLCYGALGSDTGGSIRQPAALCGIVGLKPTYGRVSLRGVLPLAWSLDHVGPMTWTVADAAIMLQAMAGYDPEDVTSVDAPVPDYVAGLEGDVVAFRLGVPVGHFDEGLDPEVEAAYKEALTRLAAMTAGVREVDVPGLTTLRTFSGPVLQAEAYAYHAEYVAATPERYDPHTLERIRRGESVSGAMYIHARRELERLRRAVRRVFENVDVLITPTTPIPAPTIGEMQSGVELPTLRNTSPFNAYGLPTISVPCGFTDSGLPIGLQISGPPWGEPAVLRLAYAFERATDWHKRCPALDGGRRTKDK